MNSCVINENATTSDLNELHPIFADGKNRQQISDEVRCFLKYLFFLICFFFKCDRVIDCCAFFKNRECCIAGVGVIWRA